MFLELKHKTLDVYALTKKLSFESYKAVSIFPSDERFMLIQQIKRAAHSVHLNLAEGSSRKSLKERRRFYEIARGSIVEIDAAFDLGETLGYCSKESFPEFGRTLLRCYQMISRMINPRIR